MGFRDNMNELNEKNVGRLLDGTRVWGGGQGVRGRMPKEAGKPVNEVGGCKHTDSGGTHLGSDLPRGIRRQRSSKPLHRPPRVHVAACLVRVDLLEGPRERALGTLGSERINLCLQRWVPSDPMSTRTTQRAGSGAHAMEAARASQPAAQARDGGTRGRSCARMPLRWWGCA